MNSESGYLDNLIYSTIQNEVSLPKLGVKLIGKRFNDLGIALTDAQENQLRVDLERISLEDGNFDRLSVDLDDEQERQLKRIKGEDISSIELNLDELDDLPERLEQMIAHTVPEILQMVSESLLSEWKLHAKEILLEQQNERIRFNERFHRVWGNATDLLDMLISICMEEGARFNHDFREEASQNNDYIFDALTRLHARGCHVAFEILALLKNGFADGALARWRTLHELTVVAMFLSNHGQEVSERYLKHRAITNYAEAKQYQRHCNTLGYPPLSNQEFQQLKSTRDSLIKQYGNNYEQDNGWAADVLGKKRPTFADIEKNVCLDHLDFGQNGPRELAPDRVDRC